jgi:outer membrane protein assembly factor BamB
MFTPIARVFFLAWFIGVLGAPALPADDWPQFRGPRRDGRSAETGLLKSWPDAGPSLLWTIQEAGIGFSGAAIVGDRLVTMGMDANEQFIVCFNVKDGKRLWRVKNGPIYKNSFGDGPRCTPTVDGDRVYALGARGDLCCLKLETGQESWRCNILDKFSAVNIQWGISESPLVDGNLLIVTPGGAKGTMAALDKLTGATVWTSQDPAGGAEEAGYASPIAFDIGTVRQYATFTALGAIGVRASDGKFLWRYDKVANGTANITTPVFHRNQIFYTSNYGTGCALLELKPGGAAEEVYFNRNLKNHHGGVVLHEGYLYGYDDSILTCLEWSTGKVAWKNRSVGKGSVTYAEGLLYVLSENGVMGLVRATPTEYQEVSRFKVPSLTGKPTWTYPIIAGGRLYLRDQHQIHCYDVKAK